MLRPTVQLLRLEKWMLHKVGTRGSCLFLFGLPWLLLGVGFVTSPMERFSRPGPGGFLDFLDEGPWVYVVGSVWIVGGGTALYNAVRRRWTCKDDWGFNGLGLPPLIWGMCYWWSFAVNLFSGGESGRSASWIAGLVYFSITMMVIFLSRHLRDDPTGPCPKSSEVE